MRLIMMAKNAPNEPAMKHYYNILECANIEYRELTYENYIYALIIAKDKVNDNDAVVAIRRLDDGGRVIIQDDTITDIPLRDIIEESIQEGYICIDIAIGYVGTVDLKAFNRLADGNICKAIHELYEDFLNDSDSQENPGV